MAALRRTGLEEAIRDAVGRGRLPARRLRRPAAAVRELGRGRRRRASACCPAAVERLEGAERLPHMGWNDVEPVGPTATRWPPACPPCAYFAHSYAVARRRPGGARRDGGGRRPLRVARRRRPGRRRAVPPRALRGRRPGDAARLPGAGAMLRRRVIPCLDVSGGRVVKGVNFVNLRDCGEPGGGGRALRRAGRRRDLLAQHHADDEAWRDLLGARWSAPRSRSTCRVTVGGGVKEERHVRDLLAAGADKVSINTRRAPRPGAGRRVRRARTARQCIVVAIDAKRRRRRLARLRAGRAHADRRVDAVAGPRRPSRRGAGELLVTSMDTDGTKQGYALDLLGAILQRGRVPVIARGRRRRGRSTSPTRSRPAARPPSPHRSSTTGPTRWRR